MIQNQLWTVLLLQVIMSNLQICTCACKLVLVLQVNLCQKLLFLHQLTQNMTTDCSLNYKFNAWKFRVQTWGEHVVHRNSEQFLYTTCSAKRRSSDKDLSVNKSTTITIFFISDFDNHIYVTTDAEAFFFLHDLISSYLKEKERVLNIQQQQHGN